MTPRLLRRLNLGDERGIALVMAMLVLTVLAIALSSSIYFTGANQRTASYAKQAQVATTLAEAGINDAVAVLANNPSYLNHSDLLPPRTNTYEGGTVTWSGTLDTTNLIWVIRATGTVANPTGPTAAPIRKTMTAKAQISLTTPPGQNLEIWNWLYSPAYSGAAGVCDTTIDQQVTIAANLWVGGNLCLNNGANVQAPIYVGHHAYLKNPFSKIGTSGSPVSAAYIGDGCQFQTNVEAIPCRSEPTTPHTNVWVAGSPWNPTQVPTQFNQVIPPSIDWQSWYDNAMPGPRHGCQTQSGAAPMFDADTVLGGLTAPVFNLTPDGSDYTCKTINGELSWNHTTRTLTVAGVIFFDGSVTATTSSNKPIVYAGPACAADASPYDICHTNTGQAVIYVTGTLSITGEHLCAVVSGGDCDQNNWDPNKRMLIFATHGQGGYLTAGDGIEVTTSQTSFQGGLYADNRIVVGQGAWTQGPLVSGTATLVVGQTNTIWFPRVTIGEMPLPGDPPYWKLWPPFDFKG